MMMILGENLDKKAQITIIVSQSKLRAAKAAAVKTGKSILSLLKAEDCQISIHENLIG
mgnify:CR=1 FL=1